MLDFRILTFLSLCETMNYTKTARLLHISQPTVTQHIQYLEQFYGCSLFCYSGKTLTLTKKGELLLRYAKTMHANALKLQELLSEKEDSAPFFRMGATKSIGSYVIPSVLSSFLQEHRDTRMSLMVDNTRTLLKELDQGNLDFALVEGFFSKEHYGFTFLKEENFIPVAAYDSPLPRHTIPLEALFSFPLFLREKGSGTRNILEQALYERSFTLEHFHSLSEISDFTVIKELVKQGLGITFLYEPVVKKELEEKSLRRIFINGLHITREFNFVYLKNNLFTEQYQSFFAYCQKELV